jgi:hypothetical protein
MSDLYGFFVVVTYIGLLIYSLVEGEKKEGGAGLFIGLAIMGIPYSLFWPVFYLFLIWFYFSDKK